MSDVAGVLVPLGFFGMVFGFPLLRREMNHRHLMEKLRLEQAQAAAPVAVASEGASALAPALALRLPEPHRLYALALLCRLQDAATGQPGAGQPGTGKLDARTQFLVTQTRDEYLPQTLSAYLNVSAAARQQLQLRGQTPEMHLQEQLELMSKGIDDALALDYSAAQQVLTQGAFLREVFAPEAEKIRV